MSVKWKCLLYETTDNSKFQDEMSSFFKKSLQVIKDIAEQWQQIKYWGLWHDRNAHVNMHTKKSVLQTLTRGQKHFQFLWRKQV